jgi:uncharacterized repeat protein (TIGR01451 family)
MYYALAEWGGLYKTSGSEDFQQVTEINQNDIFSIQSLHVDQSDNVWLGLYGKVLVKSHDSNEFIEITNDLLTDNWVNAITSGDGKTFLATSKGLILIADNVWTLLTEEEGLLGVNLRDVAVDGGGILWVLSDKGVTKMSFSEEPVDDKVRGLVFHDIDGDGIKGDNEPGLKGHFVKLSPSNSFVITDSNGNFSFTPIAGTNTVTWSSKGFWTIEQSQQSYVFAFPTSPLPSVKFALSLEIVEDAAVTLTGSVARPGFDVHYYLGYRNAGSVALSTTLKHKFDSRLTFTKASIEPDRVNGNILEWDVADLKPAQYRQIDLTFNLSATTPLGATLENTGSILMLAGETNDLDNADTLRQIVVGSFDPNDKLVKEGVLEENFVLHGQRLTYTIRFQNTGTDTAFNIKVKDVIHPSIELTSLEVLAASHNYELSVDNREITFWFNNIKLPDSVRNEAGSHGYIKFRLRPIDALADYSTVTNEASIFFDFNEPVITNEVLNTYVSVIPDGRITALPTEIGNVRLYPNPAIDRVVISGHEALSFRQVEIINGLGHVISRQSFSKEIDTSKLPAGVYVFRLRANARVASFKVVIRD